MTINNPNQNYEPSLELNLNALKNYLIKNKKIIIKSTFLIFIPSLFYSFIKKPNYEGTFQIVLSNNDQKNISVQNKASLLTQYSGMADFLNIGGNFSKKLETEVKILESPLILMPSFKYVKNFLKENGANVQNLTFEKWKKKLNVLNLKRTSVLDVSYRDKNRDLIIQVLNLVSKDYQKYSGRDRLRSIDNGINYLEDQVEIIKEKSREAYKNAFIFAVKNNLDTNIINTKSDLLLSYTKKEGRNLVADNKYRASLELKFIEKQLEILKNINDNNINKVLYDIPKKDNKLYSKLIKLDQELIEAKLIYQESDIYIKNLVRQRKILTNTIIQNTKNTLESQKFKYQSLLKSLERPNEILIKDRELKEEANRLIETYQELTTVLQKSKLEKAKKLDPWELISNPTLKEEPVGIRNSLIPFIGIALGGLFGIFIAKYNEDQKELIFDLESFEKLIHLKKLCQLSITNKNLWSQYIELICQIQNDVEEFIDLNLIYLGNSIAYRTEINKLFSNSYKTVSVDNKLDKNKSHILIVESGKFNKFELFTFKEKCNLINPEIIGFIFIS